MLISTCQTNGNGNRHGYMSLDLFRICTASENQKFYSCVFVSLKLGSALKNVKSSVVVVQF